MLHPTITGEFAVARARALFADAERRRLARRAVRPARGAAGAAGAGAVPGPGHRAVLVDVDIERVAVRPMRPADDTAVRALLTAHGSRPSMHALNPALGVVAVVEDEVVGAAVSYFTYYREGGAEVAVAPGWQGAGVGRFLARALARELLAAQPSAGAA